MNNPLIMPNIGLMFWTLITFILLLITLRKFAWKPILDGLKNREQSIEDALSEARKAREEMGNLKAENETLLAQARQERDKILKEAKEIREKLLSDAKTQAQEEGRKIVADAKASIDKEKQAAFRELREQVVSLAIEASTKILKKELSSQPEQEGLIENYINQVNAN
jgi:F-type H+-transporting ATPase subunit b